MEQSTGSKPPGKRLLRIAGTVISVGLLAYLFATQEREQILDGVRQMPAWVLAAVVDDDDLDVTLGLRHRGAEALLQVLLNVDDRVGERPAVSAEGLGPETAPCQFY